MVGALDNGPMELRLLLGDYAADDPIWDFRPDPNRFSLREVMAHLADWNDIYRERIERTRDEENPLLPNCDEGQIAIERRYSESNPVSNLRRYQEGRQPLVEVVKALRDDDWDRIGTREGLGEMTLGEQIPFCAAHDAYHVRQSIAYRELWGEQAKD